MTDLSHAIQLNPDDAEYYVTRAEIFRAIGRNAEADTDEEKARLLTGPE